MRDQIGERKISLELPEHTPVSALKARLAEEYPQAAGALEATLVSINRDYASDQALIPAGAEVAMFPHVSGG